MDIENVIKVILNGKRPSYDHGIDISLDAIKLKGGFSTGSAFAKGILCILSLQNPTSFDNDVKVTIDNAWLAQGNSKNYHHFFPKKYMEKHHKDIDATLVNHIANITIVDSYLNKAVIKAKAPHVYMSDFASLNDNIEQTMETHLIKYNSSDDYGIKRDDYLLFFNERIKAFQQQLLSRIVVNPNIDIV